MKHAVIIGGRVDNLIEWDGDEGSPAEGEENWQSFSERAWPGATIVPVPDDSAVSAGWSYVNDEFVAPQPPQPEPKPVPDRVTMRQARLALLGVGKYDQVQAAIDAMTGPEGRAAQIEWEFATDVERASPVVQMLAGLLALDSDDLDALFTTAAEL